jgi:disulfide oxidoreductase YuzD
LSSSPSSFNEHNHQITIQRKEEEIEGTKISKDKDFKPLLFADDQVTVADSENELKFIYKVVQT